MSAPRRYIVGFKDSATQADIEKYIAEIVQANGASGFAVDPTQIQRYTTAIKGFAAPIPDQYFAKLQNLQGVDGPIEFIEEDSKVSIQ